MTAGTGYGARQRRRRARAGSVMLESVVALPVLLVLMLGCAQIAHIWVARVVVHYAAYCAARAGLVCSEQAGEYNGDNAGPTRAAREICAWAVMGQSAGEEASLREIPGWGSIPGSGSVNRKTRVRLQTVPSGPGTAGEIWNVEATVEMDFALIAPLVGPIIAWGVDPWSEHRAWAEQHVDATGNRHRYVDTVEYPHMILKESVTLPKPYVTVTPTEW